MTRGAESNEISKGNRDEGEANRPTARSPSTINDVAARAGVSKSTVSKYLTSTPYVSAEASERIRLAIAELGFRPNNAARALVRSPTRYIAVLMPSIANPYQVDLLRGIEYAAAPHNLSTILAISDRRRHPDRDVVGGLLKTGADGIIITNAREDDPELVRIQQAGIPMVLAGRHISRCDFDCVYTDNNLGTTLAIRHLVSRGHRRIAHIPGPLGVLDFRERADRYAAALKENGLEPLPFLAGKEPGLDPENGRQALRMMLKWPARKRPTAVFVGADWIALGFLAEAARHGIRIPDDLAVIGFDNASISSLMNPSLSTIDGDPQLCGQRAVDLLLARISSHPKRTEAIRTVIEPRLIERHSTTGSPRDEG